MTLYVLHRLSSVEWQNDCECIEDNRNLNYYEMQSVEWELNSKNSECEAEILTTITVNEHTKQFPSDHSSQAVFNPHFHFSGA